MAKFKLLDQTSNAKDPQWLITISDHSSSIGRGFCIVPQWEDLKPKQSKADAETILRALQSHDDLLRTLGDLRSYVAGAVNWEQEDCPAKADLLRIDAAIANATGETRIPDAKL